jgi:SRSO17 transposase
MMPQTLNKRIVHSWAKELDALSERIEPRFSRIEARRRVRTYLRGLLGSVERKNSWQLAEALGESTPYGIQHLLGRADWDADEVRDDLRDYVLEHIGDEKAILVVDETGFLKKGNNSVGVKRQYTGTAGKRENCQVGVFLAYASEKGAAFIDRELYLPEEWAEDKERRERARVPEEISFATKPKLARKMLERAFGAGVAKLASWVVADSVYGDARGLLGVWLEEKEQPYVLAVSGKAHVWAGFSQPKVSEVLDALREGRLPLDESEESWERLSAGEGSKGPRLYDWIRLPLNPPMQEGFSRWLLVRRQIDDPDGLTAYVAFAPEKSTTLEELAKVAGSRWKIEEAFEEAKGEVGLDHYEVRSWVGWYRHITLAMFAHAFLCAIRASGHNQAVELSQKGAPQQSKTGSSLQDFKKRRGL